MKALTVFLLVVLIVISTTLPASAGTATGTTNLLGTAVSGSFVDVDVSVVSSTPVVAFEYAIRNECYFSGKVAGPPDSSQQDPIVDWVYSSPPPYGSVPHAIMPVYLVTVPAGSQCKVFLVKNNTFVKGSLTTYTVV